MDRPRHRLEHDYALPVLTDRARLRPEDVLRDHQELERPGHHQRDPRDSAAKKLVAARYITKKLWEFFAYPAPVAAVIDALAQVLFDNDFDIKPWVAAMLMRDEFYSTTAKQGLVRTPIEYIVALCYHTGIACR